MLFAGATGLAQAQDASRASVPKRPTDVARNPAGQVALTKLAEIKVPGKAHDVLLVDERAFVATDEGLVIIDVSNPASPRQLGQVAVPESNLGVQILGRYVFLANRPRGLVVVDVSDPAAASVVASVPVSKCWAVAVKDHFAYALGLGGSLHVVDISNPPQSQEVLRIGLPAWRPADYNHKPASPEQERAHLASLQSNTAKGGNYKTGLYVRGNRLAAVDWVYGRIFLYDVTEPARPSFRGTHFAPYLLQVVMTDDWLFGFAAYNRLSGVYSVPIADLAPDKPTGYHAGTARGFLAAGTGVDMGGIGISGNGKYVCWYGGKAGQVQLIDVSDPTGMQLVASDSLPNHGVRMPEILGVKFQGDRIFIAAGANGLVIYQTSLDRRSSDP
jgi:hypothetical protein